MTYNPDNAIEKKMLDMGTVTEGFIVAIKDGAVKDFVKPESLKDFKQPPEATAINVISEGKYDGKNYRCETLFTYESNNDVVTYDPRSNLASFKKIYSALPKVGMKVKHIVNAKGYFKLMVKV